MNAVTRRKNSEIHTNNLIMNNNNDNDENNGDNKDAERILMMILSRAKQAQILKQYLARKKYR